MRSFTVGAVVALLASLVAGARLDVVDTLQAEVGAINVNAGSLQHSAAEVADVGLLQTARVLVNGKYYLAVGTGNPEDSRAADSSYVCGVTDQLDAASMHVIWRKTATQLKMFVLGFSSNPMAPLPSYTYVGVHGGLSSDSFDDASNSLRVSTKLGYGSSVIWSIIAHPSKPSASVLEVKSNYDSRARNSIGWYLTISDSPEAERDSDSVYLSVTDDVSKAATVELKDFLEQ